MPVATDARPARRDQPQPRRRFPWSCALRRPCAWRISFVRAPFIRGLPDSPQALRMVCKCGTSYLDVADLGGFNRMSPNELPAWHGTTILTVRKGGSVVIGGDGQVSIGQTIVKSNAKKVRRLGKGDVIGGFAGATADAFTLFERLEGKLETIPGQLTRAAVELAKDWRTDRYLRRLEAMMIVADAKVSLVLTGTGDVLEPEIGVMGIGSGGNYALASARALLDGPLDARGHCSQIARYRSRYLCFH